MLAPALALAVAELCPKEMFEKAKMATVRVKILRVVFIMNIF
jgi:hypothetical protein